MLRNGEPGGPRIIFVHGTPGSADGWLDYLVQPPAGTEVLALDRPGFGQSGPPGPVVSLAAQAAAVVALLPKDNRRTVLVGHSLGGAVVAQVAAEPPERVHALVLLASSLDPAQESVLAVQRVAEWPPVRALLPRALRNANAELMAFEAELRALAPLLPRIRAAVLIVHGTQDQLVPAANVPYMQAGLTGARCVHTVMLEGLNHFLPWNSEASVRGALRRALGDTC